MYFVVMQTQHMTATRSLLIILWQMLYNTGHIH